MIGLSRVFQWAGAGVTYEVLEPPQAAVEETYLGGSAGDGGYPPAERADAEDRRVVTETVVVRGC